MIRIGGALVAIALVMLLVSFTPWLNASGEETENPAILPLADKQQSAKGRDLFLAKGCVTCHKHESIRHSGQVSIGINLSHYQPDPDFVRRWLRNPAAIRPQTLMPDLQLNEAEIEALIAFLNDPTGESEVLAIPTTATPQTCAITQQPERPFRPPEPYSPDSPYDDHFWYGTEALWTLLPANGLWQQLPHDEHGFSQKIFWWREGYDWREEPLPELTITAERLDAAAPIYETSEATNGFHPDLESFMLTGVTIPTAGCWQITAQHQGQELSFVVLVT